MLSTPSGPVDINFTVNIPYELYVCVGLLEVDVIPSPKSQ